MSKMKRLSFYVKNNISFKKNEQEAKSKNTEKEESELEKHFREEDEKNKVIQVKKLETFEDLQNLLNMDEKDQELFEKTNVETIDFSIYEDESLLKKIKRKSSNFFGKNKKSQSDKNLKDKNIDFLDDTLPFSFQKKK
jgi:hypothetical protein